MTTTHYIPNTNVPARVINNIPPNDYVPLFLTHGATGNGKNLGSINAGTSNAHQVFAVGLGGINRAFNIALGKAGQNTSAYQNIHQNIYNAAGTSISAFQSKFAATDPLRFSFMLKPDPSFNLPGYDGIVFIDVFNNTQLPGGNPLNYGMIYLVPPDHNTPNNYPDDAAFLKAVEASCITIVKAVDLYNTTHATAKNPYGLQAINNIRMCLFSGGIYRGYTVNQDTVALHNLLGLEQGIKAIAASNPIAEVVFENSFDTKTQQNVFRVIPAKLATSPTP